MSERETDVATTLAGMRSQVVFLKEIAGWMLLEKPSARRKERYDMFLKSLDGIHQAIGIARTLIPFEGGSND